MNYDEAAANSKRHYIGAIARLSAMASMVKECHDRATEAGVEDALDDMVRDYTQKVEYAAATVRSNLAQWRSNQATAAIARESERAFIGVPA